jgi:ribosome recycling factor
MLLEPRKVVSVVAAISTEVSEAELEIVPVKVPRVVRLEFVAASSERLL